MGERDVEGVIIERRHLEVVLAEETINLMELRDLASYLERLPFRSF